MEQTESTTFGCPFRPVQVDHTRAIVQQSGHVVARRVLGCDSPDAAQSRLPTSSRAAIGCVLRPVVTQVALSGRKRHWSTSVRVFLRPVVSGAIGPLWQRIQCNTDGPFLRSLVTHVALSGPRRAGNVGRGTFEGLSGLRTLNLSYSSLSTLPPSIFSGVPNLNELVLSGNDLGELPDGVFHGLSSLRVLWLDGNKVEPMPIEVSLVSTASGDVKATVPVGAPFAIEVPVTVQNGTIPATARSQFRRRNRERWLHGHARWHRGHGRYWNSPGDPVSGTVRKPPLGEASGSPWLRPHAVAESAADGGGR